MQQNLLIFPINLKYNLKRQIVFSTDIVTSIGSMEYRNSNWEYPLSQYLVELNTDIKEELDRIIAFFYIHKGSSLHFKFRDVSDYFCINQILKPFKADKKSFRLIKHYDYDGSFYAKEIRHPDISSIQIVTNGQIITNFKFEDGLILLEKECDEINISFEFFTLARFLSDEIEVKVEDIIKSSNQGKYIAKIELIEVKV